MRTIATCTVVMVIMVLFSALSPANAENKAVTGSTAARQIIDQFHQSLLSVMKKANETSVADRYKVLEPEIANKFDSRLMIALATGKYWRGASDQTRERLANAFQRFSTATYASRFSGYSGQTFRTLGVDAGPRKTELVKTEITRPNDTPVAITYVTRLVRSGWRIVDVLVDDGISELAVRRSEYRSVLKSGGVDGLIDLLTEKTAKLLNPQG